MWLPSSVVRTWLLLTAAGTAAAAAAGAAGAEGDDKTPPPFFFQDPQDSLCLAGSEFKRCSIETLWFVTGASGDYKIVKRPTSGTIQQESDLDCLTKKSSCADQDLDKVIPTAVGKCSHCGASGWTILGDSEQGYLLVQSDGKSCLMRQKAEDEATPDAVVMAPCDSPDTSYTPLQLQFASAADIETMSAGGARLVSAASDGDLDKIKELLAQDDISVNAKDWDDLTALIPAASGGYLEICKYLVDQGVDVNAADKDGITALMEASIMGHLDVVKYLVEEAGATLDATAESGITALWLAASDGQDDVVQFLLEKGADPSNTRVDDIAAIMTAAVGGHVSVLKLLLEHKASPVVQDKDGLTPLMNAAEKGNLEVIQALVAAVPEDTRSGYINQVSNSGFSALIVASAHGNTDAVRYLLEQGANVDEPQPDTGVTALMYAGANKKLDTTKLLVETGKANIDLAHSGGGTALSEACTSGSIEIVKYLIEKGADVNMFDSDAVSPLMGIASAGDLEGVLLIIGQMQKDGTFDKELNRMSHSGGTPIMFAAAGGHTEVVEHFISLGADLEAKSVATPEYLEKMEKAIAEGTTKAEDRHVDGVTVLHVSAQGGHLNCTKALLKGGANVNALDAQGRTPLVMALKGNWGEASIALVESGADPNTIYTDEEGVSHNLLFDALMVENEEFATVLIQKGADIYYQDEKKVTTLLQACHRGLADVAQLLVNANTKGSEFLDSPSDEGVTPLIAASSEGHLSVVQMLLKAGANVNAADMDGTTPLMPAAARGHVEIAEALLKAGGTVNTQNSDGHTALMYAYNGKNQLQTLFERYNQYVDDNTEEPAEADDGGTGPLIQEALSNHTAMVDLLLKNGADASLKDKEGHTAKDFDYHPDAPESQDGASDPSKAEL